MHHPLLNFGCNATILMPFKLGVDFGVADEEFANLKRQSEKA